MAAEAVLLTCPRCGALVEEVRRPGGTASFSIPIPPTPWRRAQVRTISQEYPPASWLRDADGRPHRHQGR